MYQHGSFVPTTLVHEAYLQQESASVAAEVS